MTKAADSVQNAFVPLDNDMAFIFHSYHSEEHLGLESYVK